MRLAIAHLGSVGECFVASALNRRLRGRDPDVLIDWIVASDESKQAFEYAKNVSSLTLDEFAKTDRKYNGLLSLHPDFPVEMIPSDCEGFGFGFDRDADEYYDILMGRKKARMNLFQVYFRIAGLIWRGESYDMSYYPRSKSKKNRAGIAIANARLRQYVSDNLDLPDMKNWIVPYKKSIFRRMDEINRCRHIVTDDFLTMHLAIFLRKYVHYLDVVPRNVRLEFFGNGRVYPIPVAFLR